MSNTITRAELDAMVDGAERISPWMVIDQSRIDLFADVTEDPQFIHVDAERAKRETPFGGTIAHGFLSLSVLSKFAIDVEPSLENALMGINYGLNKVRFLNPVKSGSRIRGRFITRKIEQRSPQQIMTTTDVTVEIEGETKPALIAEWLGLIILGEPTKQESLN